LRIIINIFMFGESRPIRRSVLGGMAVLTYAAVLVVTRLSRLRA